MTSLWKNRSFVSLWLAQVASNIGDQFYSIALLWYLLQQTKSASALSLIAIPDMVAGFLFYLIGGILADRYNPPTLMIGADTLVRRITYRKLIHAKWTLLADHNHWWVLSRTQSLEETNLSRTANKYVA